METFGNWLLTKLETEGWSQSELARRCNVSHVAISRVINGERKPGVRLCKAIARTFTLPETYVLRKAGLIEGKASDGEESLEQIIESLQILSANDREVVANLVLSLLGGQRAREASGKTSVGSGPEKARSKHPS
jgi:transcriptional regulator with XRE-family HTH domain